VIGCLDDPELPVRCQAALALQPLLRHEYVVNAMRPQIPQLMQRLLTLVNEVDADMLSMVMEEFVEQFSNELTPFAVDLAANLVRVRMMTVNCRRERVCVFCRKMKKM
jgi:importin-7